MSKYDEIHEAANAEMLNVYKGMDIGSCSEYAFKAGFFSGKLAVVLEENDKLKAIIAQYKKEMGASLSTNTPKSN